MRKTQKIRKIKKKIYKGGLVSEFFPETKTLALFPVTDVNINNFKRHFLSPKDCVINALQIIGIIEEIPANLMRISSIGYTGFTKEQIEIMFIYLTGRNHDFVETTNREAWTDVITRLLPPGNVVFAGYEGHVFLIGKDLENKIMYIDPQTNPPLCYTHIVDCPINKIISSNPDIKLYLLRRSEEQLDKRQIQIVRREVEKMNKIQGVMHQELAREVERLTTYKEQINKEVTTLVNRHQELAREVERLTTYKEQINEEVTTLVNRRQELASQSMDEDVVFASQSKDEDSDMSGGYNIYNCVKQNNTTKRKSRNKRKRTKRKSRNKRKRTKRKSRNKRKRN